MAEFILNDETVEFSGDGSMPLLWYLRDHAKLVGTKFGCGIGSCGACTVHVDGRALRSCSLPMNSLEGKRINTIESLAPSASKLHPVQQAWVEFDVPQCGYCQVGQIMAVTEFLQRYPNPTDSDIDQNLNNLCRCGTYTRMRKAIFYAAKLINEQKHQLEHSNHTGGAL